MGQCGTERVQVLLVVVAWCHQVGDAMGMKWMSRAGQSWVQLLGDVSHAMSHQMMNHQMMRHQMMNQ